MIRILTAQWRVLVVRGVLALLLGAMAMLWPGIALTALVLLFGVYAIVDGVLAISASVRSRREGPNWRMPFIEGVISLGAGLLVLIWPGITAAVLLYLIALWAFVTGVFEMVMAFRLRRQLAHERLLMFSGLVSVLFGLLIALWPALGWVMLIWLIAFYALFFGVLLIMLGISLRRYGGFAAG